VSFLRSLGDTAIVARFQLLRALRTRTALLLCLSYMLVATGGSWLFTRILLQVEHAAARTLRVPETDRPGAMLEVLRGRGELRDFFSDLLGDPGLVDWAMELPFLTVIHFWLGLGFLPFLALAVGADAVSPDLRERTLRWELVRTGRLELLFGRLLALSALAALAVVCSGLGTWLVAMLAMVKQPPLQQATSLLALSPRLLAWSLPWVGVGIACSQLTATVNLARSLALFTGFASWIAWGWLSGEIPRWQSPGWLSDLLSPLLPQGWMLQLWGPGTDWTLAAAVLTALAAVGMLSGYPLFSRKDL
jgi:ABC-type transport system involved in multi-copper enzyme maturation permease subunit